MTITIRASEKGQPVGGQERGKLENYTFDLEEVGTTHISSPGALSARSISSQLQYT